MSKFLFSRPSLAGPSGLPIREAATRWMLRKHRGLSSDEALEFEHWLKADPRHAAAMERATFVWDILGRMPADLAMSAPAARPARFPTRWRVATGLAAAAALALVYAGWRRTVPHGHPIVSAVAPSVPSPRALHLPDGTTVVLGSGSEVLERFTPAERRVLLLRGDADFEVAKNPARPFLVRAGAVEIRAVGTAFNVSLRADQVEVVVTEGRVHVAVAAVSNDAPAGPAASYEPMSVHAGQRAVVNLALPSSPRGIEVSDIQPAEMAQERAWERPLLRLGGATLAELAMEFERQTGRRVVLADAELAGLRIGGQFRSNDLDGFVRLLKDDYGVVSERTQNDGIILRKAR